MKTFILKNPILTAVQFDGTNATEVQEFCGSLCNIEPDDDGTLLVHNEYQSGRMERGDWAIKGDLILSLFFMPDGTFLQHVTEREE